MGEKEIEILMDRYEWMKEKIVAKKKKQSHRKKVKKELKLCKERELKKYKVNHELYLKNLHLMEENEKLRKRVEVMQEEHQQLFSELINKLSNGGANNLNTNAQTTCLI